MAFELRERRRARLSLLDFLRYAWWMPHKLVVGRHTRAIADRLTRAVQDFREGKSTCLLVAVPFRHGKSDLVSRALPAWFLGVCADMHPDVILSGYGATLVQTFSKRIKAIMFGERFQSLFRGVFPGRGTNSAAEWSVAGSAGTVTAQALGASLTGKGGHLVVCDDYCRNRAEAVSTVYRNKTWDAFANNLMTRCHPVSIVVVCATPWHVDDLRGRIKRKMAEDPKFPRFEELRFPARNDDGSYLFSDRFSDEWYEGKYAFLGKQAAALLDCEPIIEGGARFAVDRVVIHETDAGWPEARESRGWDLASSAKERDSDDPDWTVGVRGNVTEEKTSAGTRRHIWIRDIVAIRAEAPERDRLIRNTALKDGPAVAQAVEAFGAYKDAYTTLKAVLTGVATVRALRPPGDKSAKLAPLEPSFEAGLVHILRGAFYQQWHDQFLEFPDGKHDDFPDATGVLWHDQTKPRQGSAGAVWQTGGFGMWG